MLGHAVDLSLGGMGIHSSGTLPIGATVTCWLALDGRTAALPGRIAWGRQPHEAAAESSHGMGVCFEPLPGYEADVLRHMVLQSKSGYRAVELRFAGLERPVVARAQARGRGLRLSAVLPIFARGTELTFQLDEAGPVFTGHIADAAVRDEGGMRRLDIEVEIATQDAVRYRREVRYGYAAEVDPEAPQGMANVEASAQTLPPFASPPATPTVTRPVTSPVTPAWRRIAELSLAGLVGIGAASVFAARHSLSNQGVRVSTAAPARASSPRPSPVARLAVAAATSTPPETAQQDKVQAASAIGGEPSAADKAAAVSVLPEVKVEGARTRVRVPYDGGLENAQSQFWKEPHALAIRLPDGHSTLTPGIYAIGRGGVANLRLRSDINGTLLRIYVANSIKRYSLSTQDGLLEVELEHPEGLTE